MAWRVVSWLAAFALLVAIGPDPAATHNFNATSGVQLCNSIPSPCVDVLTPGINADMTVTLAVTGNELLPGVLVTLAPQGATIHGAETNAQCANTTDDDADTKINDGCPQNGHDWESNRCSNATNDDSIDDVVSGQNLVNDGCPALVPAETLCSDAIDNDGDTRVNDGCFPGGMGGAQPESGGWCAGADNDDPRDDAAGGGQKVNDGCPEVGAAETACDDATDSDGDTTVNDGCFPVGGVEAEVYECDNSTDDDADGWFNDGCPGFGVPALGAVVGKVSVNPVSYGLANNACTPQSQVNFTLMNGTTDNSPGNEMGTGDGHPQGAMGPFRDDSNGNYLPDHVDSYPEFANWLLDPDRVGDIDGDGDHFDTLNGIAENPGAFSLDWYGDVEPLRPLARYSGTTVINGNARLLQLLVFNPAALAGFTRPHLLSDLSNQTFGFAMVAIFDDPTFPVGPDPITDECSPSTVKIMLRGVTRANPCLGPSVCNTGNGCLNGEEYGSGGCPSFDDTGVGMCTPTDTAGCVRYASPATAGTHFFSAFQQSQRDLDGDGYENALDTCPHAANIDVSPRAGSGPDQPNGDMLDSVCDPTPTTQNNNADGDTHASGGAWLNAGDNCPLIANADQKDSERTRPYSVGAQRGGSRIDAIGDDCDGAETSCADALDNDASPHGPEGLINDGCPVLGTSGAESVCTGSADDDGDGFVNDGCPAAGAAETACANYVSDDDDNGDTVINASDYINDGCAVVGTAAEFGCLNSFDDDGDTVVNDGCASSAVVANGHYHTVFKLIPKCIGGIDIDADGWCDLAATDPLDDPDDLNAGKTPEHYAAVRFFPVAHSGSGMANMGPGIAHPREPLQVCNDGIDNDGDTLIDLLDGDGADGDTYMDCNPRSVALPTTDTDGDGYPDASEIYIGTDAMGRCEKTGTAASQSNDWPADHVGGATSGDKITLADISTYTATPKRLDTKPGDANFLPRFDINPGTTTPGATQNWIVLTDLSNISSLIPPMFNGAEAFGGPTCAAHLTYGD